MGVELGISEQSAENIWTCGGGQRSQCNEGTSQNILGSKSQEHETGEACRAHGRYEKCLQNFGRKCRKERQIGWKGVDWIHLAQDREQWRALVNTVMNLRVP
jgi:hypothetical protein